jgi:hypothetical protein
VLKREVLGILLCGSSRCACSIYAIGSLFDWCFLRRAAIRLEEEPKTRWIHSQLIQSMGNWVSMHAQRWSQASDRPAARNLFTRNSGASRALIFTEGHGYRIISSAHTTQDTFTSKNLHNITSNARMRSRKCIAYICRTEISLPIKRIDVASKIKIAHPRQCSHNARSSKLKRSIALSC